jgi:hypothetical protein
MMQMRLNQINNNNMKKIILQESEKTEILSQHNRFKTILKETLDKKNKGLDINNSLLEQSQGIAQPPTGDELIKKAQQVCNTLKSAKLFKLNNGTLGLNLKASVDGPLDSTTNKPKYVAGDVLIYQNNMIYDVYDGTKVVGGDWQKKGTYRWKCGAINQEYNNQTAAAKKAEEDKKAQIQQGLTTQQKQFSDGLVAQGYVIDPSPWDITSKRLKKADIEKIPGLEVLFPNGLNVYYDPTLQNKGDIQGYKERSANMTIDVNTCKDFVQTYWDDYKGGGEGNLEDTQFADLKNKVQACANKWYPKWSGLSGGVLGIGDGQNRLNDKIDVLTGRKTSYEGVGIPSRTTGWGLTPPRSTR